MISKYLNGSLETCDDGIPGSNSTYKCNDSCEYDAGMNQCFESKWKTVCPGDCGNGTKSSSEQCDDGNLNDGDGCN